MEKKREVGPEKERKKERDVPPSRWNWIRSRKINRVGWWRGGGFQRQRGSRRGGGGGASFLLFYNERRSTSKKKKKKNNMRQVRRLLLNPAILNRIIHRRRGQTSRKMSRSFAISGAERLHFKVKFPRAPAMLSFVPCTTFFPCNWHEEKEGEKHAPLFPEHCFEIYIPCFEGKKQLVARNGQEIARFETFRKASQRKRVRESFVRRKNYSVSFSSGAFIVNVLRLNVLFDPNRGNYFISSRRYGIKLRRERKREIVQREGKEEGSSSYSKDTNKI